MSKVRRPYHPGPPMSTRGENSIFGRWIPFLIDEASKMHYTAARTVEKKEEHQHSTEPIPNDQWIPAEAECTPQRLLPAAHALPIQSCSDGLSAHMKLLPHAQQQRATFPPPAFALWRGPCYFMPVTMLCRLQSSRKEVRWQGMFGIRVSAPPYRLKNPSLWPPDNRI